MFTTSLPTEVLLGDNGDDALMLKDSKTTVRDYWWVIILVSSINSTPAVFIMMLTPVCVSVCVGGLGWGGGSVCVPVSKL